MRIKVRVADPAGNITIFVMTPVEREKYPAVCQAAPCQKRPERRAGGLYRKEGPGRFSDGNDGRRILREPLPEVSDISSVSSPGKRGRSWR